MKVPFDEKTNHNQVTQTLNPVLIRLNKMLSKNYNCQLQLYSINNESEAKAQGVNLGIIRSLSYKSQPLFLNQKIYFPIFVDGGFVGAAEVTANNELSSKSVTLLHKIVASVIESAFSAALKIGDLKKVEEQLRLSVAAPNVVPLHTKRKSLGVTSLADLTRPRKPKLSLPCLIEARSFDDIFKMALEIHNHSGRWAFLGHEDLSPDAATDAKAIHELGAITLYIGDICELTAEEQKAITEFLDLPRTEQSAQVICGSVYSYRELIKHTLVSPELIKRVSAAYLKMTKPFEEYVESGLLDFFYDSLTGRQNGPML